MDEYFVKAECLRLAILMNASDPVAEAQRMFDWLGVPPETNSEGGAVQHGVAMSGSLIGGLNRPS